LRSTRHLLAYDLAKRQILEQKRKIKQYCKIYNDIIRIIHKLIYRNEN